eukprot:c11035_g1_i2.p1 GENE.c11035_g1_i2~~c11035_g1_i2.p1  ORF type:complete len:322 (+),score=78.12 c11035_g1_i2:281-1246(+)
MSHGIIRHVSSYMGSRTNLDKHIEAFQASKEFPSVPPSHTAARTQLQYPTPDSQRCPVPDDLVPWNVPFPTYNPTNFTDPIVFKNDRTKDTGHKWADPPDFAAMEDSWRQRATQCAGDIDKLRFPKNRNNPMSGMPRNPVGRTGMGGRGLLGKWGPNQAADPIVTCLSPITGLLCMVAIKRQDTGQWAIPGGMVDDGEYVTSTLKREFMEEAAEKSVDMEQVLEEIFADSNRRVVFRGYVDDPRNTDNAWMETTVVHFHCLPHQAERLKLSAGSDAVRVSWLCVEDNNERYTNLYASHKAFVDLAIRRFRDQEKSHRKRAA